MLIARRRTLCECVNVSLGQLKGDLMKCEVWRRRGIFQIGLSVTRRTSRPHLDRRCLAQNSLDCSSQASSLNRLVRYSLHLRPHVLGEVLGLHQAKLQDIAPEEHGAVLSIAQIIKLLLLRLLLGTLRLLGG